MAEVKQPLENPRLKELMNNFKENPSDENWNQVLTEVVMRARFLMPAKITAGGSDLEQMLSGSKPKVQYIMITDNKGQAFFLAFTDEEEFRRQRMSGISQLVVMGFDDYAAQILQHEQPAGFVINPFGENLIFNREMVENLLKQKAALIQKLTEQRKAQAKESPEAEPAQSEENGGEQESKQE